ncbi:Mobile element transfer [Streptomyces sp. CC53]|uniref:mobile element transfer protein n=1 Tax=unclassified Streptomyces TaxID=2593676 RepID=UPI0008DC89FD|nr:MULTISPECIES: mobile element transfer protein [unclassified Streptomyces]OII62669.1 Mobile element transfer [Streptomyces sp. CC53]
MPRRHRFWDLDRIGPVQIGTHYDRHGREAHTAACTAPGCDWSADYLNRPAAELAARTHRCDPR